MQIQTLGFFDLQVNGFAGVDFNDPNCSSEELDRAIAAMHRGGVTQCLPTLITSSLERFASCARVLTASRNPAIAGIHMEGPYISPEDGPRGAHTREFVTKASVDDFCRRQEAADGRIVLVTLAPEVEGALELIEYLVQAGIKVAIGHTAADPGVIRDAVKAGATLSTHLGNGCAQSLPRHPNHLWEQLAADELHASFIVDGHHLSPAVVKTMIRAKTPSRSILVTDATAASGSSPGRYMLGGVEVELSASGRVAVPGANNLAGSALTLATAIENAVRFCGVTLEEAVAMASTIPAVFLGIETLGMVRLEWGEERAVLEILSVDAGS